ncbi:MAG: hypothetical protein WC426_14370 [Sulfuriferula sp.]
MAYNFALRLQKIRKAIDDVLENGGTTSFGLGDQNASIALETLRSMEKETEERIRLQSKPAVTYYRGELA